MAILTTSTLTGTAATAPALLFSTNPHLKYWINQNFRKGLHYAWCSPVFEGAARGRYALGATPGSSSDPCSIYRSVHMAVKSNDKGDLRIINWRAKLIAQAIEWEAAGEVSKPDLDQITYLVGAAEVLEFRPLIYVIPYASVAARVQLVDARFRSSKEPEYVVPDLREDEFEILEPMPCP